MRTDRWRLETEQPNASVEDALKGLYVSKAPSALVILPLTGMLFGAPVLIVLGLAIAGASALT